MRLVIHLLIKLHVLSLISAVDFHFSAELNHFEKIAAKRVKRDGLVFFQDSRCAKRKLFCQTGECVESKHLCDGYSNCLSGEDEDNQLCQNNQCPKDTFRCDYGACLRKNQLCDGIPNCRNGADEDPNLCKKNKCEANLFSCGNGICLKQDLVCNGQPNCKNKADEDPALCANCTCAKGLFRCDYGACLRKDLLCDGQRNCLNGADEAAELCSGVPIKADFRCTLPPIRPDKKYTINCRNPKKCAVNPGDKVPELSSLHLHCNRGYGYDHMPSKVYCINGTWVPSIGKCKRICPKLVPENAKLSCYHSRNGLKVPCNEHLVEGTLVKIQCLPSYHEQVPVVYNEIVCKSSGTWSDPLYKCVADCGQPFSPAKKLISNGTEEVLGQSPWNVAIYDVSEPKNPNMICGGTIITPQLIVSAAHCFYDDAQRKLHSAKRFQIAVAKIKRDNKVKDNSQTAFYKIRDILISEKGYSGPVTNYAGDIAILRTETKITISSVVLPACIDLDDTTIFNPGRRKSGKLSGWGYNTKNNPSDVILTADLPFISRNECLKMVTDDFQSSITIDKFCAGSTNSTGSGARPGDSGAGLMFRNPQSGLYYLRGVVSIKDPSASTSIAAFTDLSFYVNWISRIQSQTETTSSLPKPKG